MTPPRSPAQLILASRSPRRRAVLQQLGYQFTVVDVGLDEASFEETAPRERVIQLASAKAIAASLLHPKAAVLGYDTVVWYNGQLLEKPLHLDDARRMLRALAASSHTVWSGAALAHQGRIVQANATSTKVHFRPYGEEEIEYQVAVGQPLDKAGGYGIQAAGGRLVEKIDGCFYNVVGLPIFATIELIEKAGLLR